MTRVMCHFVSKAEKKLIVIITRFKAIWGAGAAETAAAIATGSALHHDCCGVFGPSEAVQHPMCAAAAAAFARDYCDNLVFLLLAPQASQWEASNEVGAVRALQEPRWVNSSLAASPIINVDATSSQRFIIGCDPNDTVKHLAQIYCLFYFSDVMYIITHILVCLLADVMEV